MTRFLRFSCAILVLAALPCFADSITHVSNVNVSLNFLPNEGFGGNVWGTLDGDGVSLFITGGTGPSWFAAPFGFAPGSHEQGGTTIYLDTVDGSLGNKTYDFLGLSLPDFKAGGLTFPTNGKDFTISVHGSLGLATAYGFNSQGTDQYNLVTNPGMLTVSFSLSPSDGLYYSNWASFESTTTAPEPSTLVLLAIGFSALPWCKWRKRHHP